MSQEEKQLVQSFLKELPEDIIIKQIKRLTVDGGYSDVEEFKVFKATKPLQLYQAQIHINLKKKLDLLGEDVSYTKEKEIQLLIDSLQPKYQVGDQFLKVVGIEKITFTQDGLFTIENSEFQAEQGFVYLLVVWDASKQYCSDRIDKYQNILEQHQLGGKVKMVCISINNEIKSVIDTMKSKYWKSIQHYRFLKGEDQENSFIKYSQMKGTPFIMLINKKGQINYLGYYPKENFEEKINKLITVKDDEEIQQVQQIQEQNYAPEPAELITKEQYKQLKQQWKTLQEALEQAKFKGKINVAFEKINFLKQDGSKEVHKKVKFFLNYKVKVKEEPKIIQFTEKYWNKIPENLRIVQKSKIIDPERKTLDIKTKFQIVFQTLGVNITYIPYYNIRLGYDSKINKMILGKSEKFQVKVDNLTIEQYQKGYKILEDDIMNIYHEDEMGPTDTLNQLIKDLLNFIGLRVGQQFQTISNYIKLGLNEEIMVEHTPSQILVINYWFKQINSIEQLKDEIEVIKQILEKWGNTVRFVYLNYAPDEDPEETMKQLQQYSDYIDFYFPKYKNQSDFILYKAFYQNNYIIVDKFGIIRKMGHAYQIDQLIERVINDQDLPQSSDDEKSVDIISQDMVDKVLAILQNAEVMQKLNLVDKEQIIQFTLFFEQTPIEGQLKFKMPRLYLVCKDYQWEVVNQILEQIFELIPEKYFDFSKKILKTFSIPYPGLICFLCNKDIKSDPQQYYSPFKKVHLCVECAEFEDKTKKGSEKYKCTDTLIFINGPLTDLSVLQRIDEYMIGKNLQLKEGEIVSQWHQIFCMGCKNGMEGSRYIATSCKSGRYGGEGFVDFCQDCFVLLKDKKSEKAKAIIEKNVKVGLIEDSLFVRILFYHGDKNKF